MVNPELERKRQNRTVLDQMSFLDRLAEIKDNMRTSEMKEVDSLLKQAERRTFVQ